MAGGSKTKAAAGTHTDRAPIVIAWDRDRSEVVQLVRSEIETLRGRAIGAIVVTGDNSAGPSER